MTQAAVPGRVPDPVSRQAHWGPPKVLLDALDVVPALDETATLRECVRIVARRLGVKITLPESYRRRTYLSSLLMAVLEYPEGLQVLGGVVDLLEGDTHHAERVHTAIAMAEVPLFSEPEWADLMMLLGGLEVPDVAQVYGDVMRYRGEPPPPAHCTEPWLAVLHAATLNARPGEPLPCVLMVQRFARYAKGQQAERLHQWAAEHDARPEPYQSHAAHAAHAGHTGHAAYGANGGYEADEAVYPDGSSPAHAAGARASGWAAAHAETRTQPTAPPSCATPPDTVWRPGACLLIRLRPLPDPAHEHERLLSYWWHLGGPEPYPVRGGDLRIDVDELPEHVQLLVEDAETGWAYFHKGELTLEFLLPRDLLHLPVEQWSKKGFYGACGTIGEDHPVLLRSLDRLERPDTHGRWGRRWDALARGNAGPAHWFPDDGRSRLLAEPLPAVVVLSAPPYGDGAAEEGYDELGEALRAGVPIVVWDRREGADPAFRRGLADVLASEGADRLPNVVKSLRIEARDEDPTREVSLVVGRNVALLWDDPYRLPDGPGKVTDPSTSRGRMDREDAS